MEAEALCQQAIEIGDKILGPETLDQASRLYSRGLLLFHLVRAMVSLVEFLKRHGLCWNDGVYIRFVTMRPR